MNQTESIRAIRHDLKSDTAAIELLLKGFAGKEEDEHYKRLLNDCVKKIQAVKENCSTLINLVDTRGFDA
jgi:hypothetical protein